MKKLPRQTRLILAAAAGRATLRVDPIPDELRGAARAAVRALLDAGLLIRGGDGPLISLAGFEALGIEPTPGQFARLSRLAAPKRGRATEPAPPRPARKKKPVKRQKPPPAAGGTTKIRPENQLPRRTKQARLVAMLARPDGASVEQIAFALGWQPHTVRGAIAGVIKKRLGLTVTSSKDENGVRIYRIRCVGRQPSGPRLI
jgi:hypothetical protein